MMVAAGRFSTNTRFWGGTTMVDGATPKEHCKIAPITTACDIADCSYGSIVSVNFLISNRPFSHKIFHAQDFFLAQQFIIDKSIAKERILPICVCQVKACHRSEKQLQFLAIAGR